MDTIMELTTPRPQTSAPHVAEIVRLAHQELTGLLQRRAELMQRIGTIRQMLSGLADLFGQSILGDDLVTILDGRAVNRRSGFTWACRAVLMESRTPLRSRQACAELQRRFPDLVQRHKDLGASVNTVFHRLANYGEARCFLDSEGMRVWEWMTDGATKADATVIPEPEPQQPHLDA